MRTCNWTRVRSRAAVISRAGSAVRRALAFRSPAGSQCSCRTAAVPCSPAPSCCAWSVAAHFVMRRRCAGQPAGGRSGRPPEASVGPAVRRADGRPVLGPGRGGGVLALGCSPCAVAGVGRWCGARLSTARTRVGMLFALAFGLVCLVASVGPGRLHLDARRASRCAPRVAVVAEFVGERGARFCWRCCRRSRSADAPGDRGRRSPSCRSSFWSGSTDRAAGAWTPSPIVPSTVGSRSPARPGAPVQRSVGPRSMSRAWSACAACRRRPRQREPPSSSGPSPPIPVALPRDARTLTGGSLAPIDSGTATPRVFGLRTIERRHDGGVRSLPPPPSSCPTGGCRDPWTSDGCGFAQRCRSSRVSAARCVFDGARPITLGERPLALTVPGSTRTDRVRLGALDPLRGRRPGAGRSCGPGPAPRVPGDPH